VLSPRGDNGLFVPSGFAHGCLTLSNESHVLIDTDNYYVSEHGTGIVWDDPGSNIEWALSVGDLIISSVHKGYSSFEKLKTTNG
jgi:dTDP-4-dehydrorhamnose 3,5-epimerase